MAYLLAQSTVVNQYNYADEIALIADSEAELQSMLNIVSSYAIFWHYELNAQKSSVLVIGESPVSRRLARPKGC